MSYRVCNSGGRWGNNNNNDNDNNHDNDNNNNNKSLYIYIYRERERDIIMVVNRPPGGRSGLVNDGQ